MFRLVYFALFFIYSVKGALYVIQPQQLTVCHGGQPCTVEWDDDGTNPLLTAIEVCTVGLFTADQHIVQQIPPVDVAAVHSLTFTPNPKAGPDSNAYYISFESTTLNVNGTSPYLAFSPSFTINNMQGSFNSPVPSATSKIPIPSSLPTENSVTKTITIGTLSTSLPPIPSLSATTPTSAASSSPSAHSQSSAGHQTITPFLSCFSALPVGLGVLLNVFVPVCLRF